MSLLVKSPIACALSCGSFSSISSVSMNLWFPYFSKNSTSMSFEHWFPFPCLSVYVSVLVGLNPVSLHWAKSSNIYVDAYTHTYTHTQICNYIYTSIVYLSMNWFIYLLPKLGSNLRLPCFKLTEYWQIAGVWHQPHLDSLFLSKSLPYFWTSLVLCLLSYQKIFRWNHFPSQITTHRVNCLR